VEEKKYRPASKWLLWKRDESGCYGRGRTFLRKMISKKEKLGESDIEEKSDVKI